MQKLQLLQRLNKILNSSRYISRKRFKRALVIEKLSGLNLFSYEQKIPLKILEAGCNTGKDFIQFLKEIQNIEITGIDVKDYGIAQENFSFVLGDIESINFPDKYFDLTISIGVLEHIQPIEKLSKVIKEIDRVSKSYVISVPAISTIIEPHTSSIFWQIRDHNRKKPYNNLNFFSDEAWLQFEGFKDAKTKRHSELLPVLKSLAIYKTHQD